MTSQFIVFGAATMIDDETGYILLRRFSATTINEVNKAIKKLDEQNFENLTLEEIVEAI